MAMDVFNRYVAPAAPFAALGLEYYALHMDEKLEQNSLLIGARFFFILDLFQRASYKQPLLPILGYTLLLVGGFAFTSMFTQMHPHRPRTGYYRIAAGLGHASNLAIKARYTFLSFQFFKQTGGLPAGVLAGAAMGALSAYNIKRAWQILPKPY